MSQPSQRGFTLIELMIVLAIIGIIAAIAIPALISALDRGRQKRTMADLNAIGKAIGTYTVDNNFFPTGSDMNALAVSLEPEYIRKLPRQDGWGNAFIVDSPDGTAYTMGSVGKDGGTTLTLQGGGGVTHSYDSDIIFVDGQFAQWPDGLQN